MRFSHLSAPLLGLLFAGGIAASLQADPITLGSGSIVRAIASDTLLLSNTDKTNQVNSLPYTTPTTAVNGLSTSTVASNITTGGISFIFTQTIESAGQTDGIADIHFTAGQGVTFSLSGDLRLTGFGAVGELITNLFDVTTNTFVYSYGKKIDTFTPIGEASISLLTLDTSGGSLTGSLTTGDSYVFHVNENMNNLSDPALAGNVAIVFAQQPVIVGPAAPLPAGGWGGMALIAGLGGALRLKRNPAV